MRRWLHCVIVALLCLTLFVDTATACWYLRHHGRGHACPPAFQHASAPAAWTIRSVPPAESCCEGVWGEAPLAWTGHVTHVIVSDRLVSAGVAGDGFVWTDGGLEIRDVPTAPWCAPCDDATHAVIEHVAGSADGEGIVIDHSVVEETTVVHDGAEHGTMDRIAPGDAVVVHDPTIVMGAAPGGTESLPAAGLPAPKVAQPAAPQPQLATHEPLSDIKPATIPTPKEQPVPASLNLPASPAAAEAMAKDAPEPAPLPMTAAPGVEDLAGGPAVVGPAEPWEENLFDEFADEPWDGDGDAPADIRTEQMPATEAADEAADAPGEPAASADEPEMIEEPSTDADPAAAATLVPDEPMRHWTDATGDHHARGWLAELRDGEVRILKVNGRYTTMAVADLSDADQAYVAAVAARLAAKRQARATDTAGL